MKFSVCSLIAAAAIIAINTAAHGQLIWSAQHAITGDSDISTAGTAFDAINTIVNGSYNTTTVGDTQFNAFSSVTHVAGNEYIATDGIITDHLFVADGNFNNHGYSGGSTAYAYVQNNGTDVTTATVTIGSLTLGHQYQIQVWGYWPGPYNADLQGTYADLSSPVALTQYSGSFTTATFTATSGSFSFNYYQDHANNGGFVDDIAVRDLGAVPEPGTWAMMLGGLGVLVLIVRARRALTL